MRLTARWRATATSLAAGLLLALSLPPWGFWPLALGGVVLLDRVIADQPAASRFRRGWLVGFALIAPTMSWMKELTVPGYLVAVVLYASITAAAATLCPPGPGRRLALPGAWLLAEALRGAWPFGGVPLSTLAVGQVGGPLAPVVRIGGTLLLAAVTIWGGIALAAIVTRHWRTVGLAGSAVVVALAAAALAPEGTASGRSIRVAYVQGGGPQGTRAIDVDPRIVFDRHLRASRRVPPDLDLTLWPEDVVDTSTDVLETREGSELAALARRLRTTLVAGVVEDAGRARFRNASVVWDPSGRAIDRYDKVQRVPFGEFVPFRSLLEKVAGDSLPLRDAEAGNGPATLDTPVAKLGVAISWEVFFGHRAGAAIRDGGEVLINPTNGSSYTGTIVQTQQVASSRLRALETGRWVVQIAPTGFSAFISPDGRVLDRTAVSSRSVAVREVGLRRGLTLYTRWGDRPVIAAGLGLLGGGWLLARRRAART